MSHWGGGRLPDGPARSGPADELPFSNRLMGVRTPDKLAGRLLSSTVGMAEGTLGRLAVLAAILVIVAAGFCLLDGDEVGGVDLCAIPLAVALTLPLALPLVLTGRSLPALVTIRPSYAPDLPAPPPKA